MKRIIFVLILALILTGCYSTISQVEHKWGPPGKTEDKQDTKVYYYYFYRGKGTAVAYKGVAIASGTEGWRVVEITTDSNGKILKKREYWWQPKMESTSPTTPTIEQPKREQPKEEQPTQKADSYHKSDVLDQDGRKIKEIYLNERGERVINTNGIYEVKYAYDNKNNITEQRHYGDDGNLREDKEFGIAIIRYQYDNRSKVIKESFYGRDGKLKEHKGSAIRRFKYDERGNRVEARCYGIDDKLKENNDGIAIYRWKYDQNGRHLESRFYGKDDKLKENNWGCAIIRRQYDEEGKEINTSFLNREEKPVNPVNPAPLK